MRSSPPRLVRLLSCLCTGILVLTSVSLSQVLIDITPASPTTALPTAVSADGSVVVGTCSASGIGNWRWTKGQLLSLGLGSSFDVGLSGDGGTALAFANPSSYRWTPSQVEVLPLFGSSPVDQISIATGSSNNGSTIVGYSAGFGARAIVWKVHATGISTVYQLDPFLPFVNTANAVSADGRRVAGTVSESSNNFSVCLWDLDDAGNLIGRTILTPGSSLTFADDLSISADGGTVTGMVVVSGKQRAYRWNAAEGIQFLAPDDTQGWPQGLSGDGQMIVGSHMFPTSEPGNPTGQVDRAFLWTASTGVVDLNVYLPTLGVSLGDWTLRSATGISADGRTIVGVGSNSSGVGRGWIYTTACGFSNLQSGLAGIDGVPTLLGTGTLFPSSSGSLSLTSAKASSLAMLFVALASTPTPIKCGTLVPVPIAFQLPLFTNGVGAINLSWSSWPGGLSGLSLYFQYAIQDSAAVCGVALSNALRAEVP